MRLNERLAPQSYEHSLRGHPKAANEGHLKTGQRKGSSGTLIPTQGSSLRRYEQRLERSEKTTSHSPGTTRMATAAHRARDRSASGDRRSLPEIGRDRRAPATCVGTATAGKTGQRQWGDHRVGRGKTGRHGQPQPQPRKPFHEGKSKSKNRKTG